MICYVSMEIPYIFNEIYCQQIIVYVYDTKMMTVVALFVWFKIYRYVFKFRKLESF